MDKSYFNYLQSIIDSGSDLLEHLDNFHHLIGDFNVLTADDVYLFVGVDFIIKQLSIFLDSMRKEVKDAKDNEKKEG